MPGVWLTRLLVDRCLTKQRLRGLGGSGLGGMRVRLSEPKPCRDWCSPSAEPWRESMARDSVKTRLMLPQIEVIDVLVDERDRLEVAVRSTVRHPRCPECSERCEQVHDHCCVNIRDLDASGRPVTLVWKRRRMICDSCGHRFSEQHPAFEGDRTVRLARRDW